MNISHADLEKLQSLHLHDSIFNGYSYDYLERKIILTCINYQLCLAIRLSFDNVIYSRLQSCSFWDGGRNILSIMEDNDFKCELDGLRKENADCAFDSYLDRGIHYISIKLVMNSGDTLQVICQSIEYIETHVDNY